MPESNDRTLHDLGLRIDAARPDARYRHDLPVLAAIREALAAAKEGNFGIGAVVADESGDLIETGRNRVFAPYFRSDAHAEMDALTRLESATRGKYEPAQLSLYSSLEPCPMCLTRLINAGVGHVYYVVEDPEGGMVRKLADLPPIWIDLARSQTFSAVPCSPKLKALALAAFQVTAAMSNERLYRRRSESRAKRRR
jgi:cytosine deaminase